MTESSRSITRPSEGAQELHRRIMNILCPVTNDLSDLEMQAYRRGHKDARHEAAELVLESAGGDVAPTRPSEGAQERCRRCGKTREAHTYVPGTGLTCYRGEWLAWLPPADSLGGDAALLPVAAPPLGWQPIATAPTDGTKVLGYGVRDVHPWCVVVRHLDRWDGWYTDPGKHHVQPTHWMPLPNPPNPPNAAESAPLPVAAPPERIDYGPSLDCPRCHGTGEEPNAQFRCPCRWNPPNIPANKRELLADIDRQHGIELDAVFAESAPLAAEAGLIAETIALFERIVAWPEDDWQGLKYHAMQAAAALRGRGAATRGSE